MSEKFELGDIHPALRPNDYAPMGSPSGKDEYKEREWKEKKQDSVYVPPPSKGINVPGTAAFIDKEYSALAGAGVGGAAGFIENIWPKNKTSLAVMEKIKDLVASGDPESIAQARRLAEIEFGRGIKAVQIPQQLLEQSYEGRASGPKIAGDSGTRNWMLQEVGQRHKLPDVILDLATDKTKASPTGGKFLIEEDLKNIDTIKELFGDKYELSGSGSSQFMLPKDIATERESVGKNLTKKPQYELNKQLDEIHKLVNKEYGITSKINNVLSRYPFLRGSVLGGIGGLDIANAIQSARNRDIPQAAISGAGGAGALASMIPKVLPRVIGSGVGLASIPAQFVYEAIKGTGQEREKNIGPKTGYLQRLKELGEEPTESEVRMAQSAGPALSRANLFVPEPTRFAGGLPRTPQ